MNDIKNKEIKKEEIKPDKKSVRQFVVMQQNNFFIPEYQRRYTWNEKNVESLFDDIFQNWEDKNAEQYFGSIAVGLDTTTSDIRVIDGQQRITTSIIFVKAFYDVLKEFDLVNKYSAQSDEIKNIFEGMDSLVTKISSTAAGQKESEALSYVLSLDHDYLKIDSVRRKRFKNLDVYNNYLKVVEMYKTSFLDEKDEINFDKLISFVMYFLDEYKFIVIVFDKNRTEEMQIFENLNSKGEPLTTFELIKNSLFLKIDPEVYEQNEKAIADEFNNNIDFASDDLLIGKDTNYSSEEETFMHAYLKFKFGINKIVNKNSKSLLVSFDELYNKKNISLKEYKEIIKDMSKYLRIYKNIKLLGIQNISNMDVLFPFADYLDIFPLTPATYPFLFFIIDKFSEGEYDDLSHQIIIDEKWNKIIVESFLQLEKWIIGIKQIKGRGDSLPTTIAKLTSFLDESLRKGKELKDFPKLIKDYLAGIDRGYGDSTTRGENNITPTDQELVISFSNTKPNFEDKLQVLILKRIDQWMLDPNLKFNKQFMQRNVSLEHIMPQTPDPESNLYKYEKQRAIESGDSNFTWEDFVEKHSTLVELLGNKLDLNLNDNESIHNNDIDEKLDKYAGVPSADIKFIVKGKEEDIKTVKIVGFEEVQARTRVMAEDLIRKVYGRI